MPIDFYVNGQIVYLRFMDITYIFDMKGNLRSLAEIERKNRIFLGL